MTDLKNEIEAVELPATAEDMLDFVVAAILVAKADDLDPTAILETMHDYICYWLHSNDEVNEERTLN